MGYRIRGPGRNFVCLIFKLSWRQFDFAQRGLMAESFLLCGQESGIDCLAGAWRAACRSVKRDGARGG